MFLISHRGNLNGVESENENSPNYIKNAISHGFHVEIDVWDVAGTYYLGHDDPQHIVNKEFLSNNRLWCHAKNIDALHHMLKDGIHCFWHQSDDVAITSKGFIWTYPGKNLTNKSIAIFLGPPEDDFDKNISGICSDYIQQF